MMQAPNLEISRQFYTEFKFWGPVIGAIWSVFKIVDWVKALKTNDLTHIQEGITNFNRQLDDGLTKQTDAFVNSVSSNTNEVRELRGDIKMLTSAILNQKTRAARAKRKKN